MVHKRGGKRDSGHKDAPHSTSGPMCTVKLPTVSSAWLGLVERIKPGDSEGSIVILALVCSFKSGAIGRDVEMKAARYAYSFAGLERKNEEIY